MKTNDVTGVVVDEERLIFRLYSRDAMYAFRVTEVGTLEHLHWGAKLDATDDLRYLTRSNIQQPFDPDIEVTKSHFVRARNNKRLFEEGPLDDMAKMKGAELFKAWKQYHNALGPVSTRTAGGGKRQLQSLLRRRLENLSWRLVATGKLDSGDDFDSVFETARSHVHKVKTRTAGSRNPRLQRASSVGIMVGRTGEEEEAEAEGFREQNAMLPTTAQEALLPTLLTPKVKAASPKGTIRANKSGLLNLDRTVSSDEGEEHETRTNIAAARARQVSGERRDSFFTAPMRLSKNTTKNEWSDFGAGDYRRPSLVVRMRRDGSSICQLTYKSHTVFPGKPDLDLSPDFPRVRCLGASFATTLVVTLEDRLAHLVVDLVYTVLHDTNAVCRRTVVRNVGLKSKSTQDVVELQRVMSATVDLEVTRRSYWLTHLTGSWARERHVEHHQLKSQGVVSFGSLRGTSSHQHNPTAIISKGNAPPTETQGTLKAFALVYSGNFTFEAEKSETGRVRVNMGINPEGFMWGLEPQESFHTPECVMLFTEHGLGDMSRQFHRIVNDRILSPRWVNRPCPILVNTWEAVYLDLSHDKVVDIARSAKQLGIEMVVVDDGWFAKRNSVSTSLGDWVPDKEKFPFGIRGLVDQVNAEGMALGIWIEPEMVSVDSDLFRAHPDWCLHVNGRELHSGRNQLVLDITRDEVRENVYKQIHDLLTLGKNIQYVKWDMNRHLTEVHSIVLRPDQQGQVGHRYVMALYNLQRRLNEAFPDIRFEGCSGGGGRFDLGLLYFVPQIWCSDNTDATVRMSIQAGTSLFYPARVVGAHYSVIPNHITQASASSGTRALVAMCGTFGYELDPRRLTFEESNEVRKHVEVFRQIRHVIANGEYYRIWDPFTMPYCASMYVLTTDRCSIRGNLHVTQRMSIRHYQRKHHGQVQVNERAVSQADEYVQEAVVFAFNMSGSFWSALAPRLKLQGLKPESLYCVSEPLPGDLGRTAESLQVYHSGQPTYLLGQNNVLLHGSTLMGAGVPLNFLARDDSFLLHIKEVQHNHVVGTGAQADKVTGTEARDREGNTKEDSDNDGDDSTDTMPRRIRTSPSSPRLSGGSLNQKGTNHTGMTNLTLPIASHPPQAVQHRAENEKGNTKGRVPGKWSIGSKFRTQRNRQQSENPKSRSGTEKSEKL